METGVEFYTHYEVSMLMSETVVGHLKEINRNRSCENKTKNIMQFDDYIVIENNDFYNY